MLFKLFIATLFVSYLILLAVMIGRRVFRARTSSPSRKKLDLDDSQVEPFLEVINLEKSFELPVLKRVSLNVHRGETLGVLGASGSGKSVLLKLIAGFLRPDHGWILFKGKDLARMPEAELLEVRKRVSYVFQAGGVFDFLTVAENIAYPLREQGVTDDVVISSRVDYLLNAVEMEGLGDLRHDELSSGGKKQVAIARAIANNPEMILYDEPTTGVDPIIGKSLSRLIRRLNKQERLTSVVVTHDMKCMEIVADRVILLKDGEIRFEGTPTELHQSSDSYVQAFVAGKRYKPSAA